MANLNKLTTVQLAEILDEFREPRVIGKTKRKFNFWKVLRNLLYFLEVIIEFLDRLEDIGYIKPKR